MRAPSLISAHAPKNYRDVFASVRATCYLRTRKTAEGRDEEDALPEASDASKQPKPSLIPPIWHGGLLGS
jgi:hypothetical protein